MTPHPTRTGTAKRLALALALALFITLLAAPPQAHAQANAAPADAADAADAGDAGGSEQPQSVATSGGMFWNSIGYLMVTLLVGASMYAVCRSSHRN